MGRRNSRPPQRSARAPAGRPPGTKGPAKGSFHGDAKAPHRDAKASPERGPNAHPERKAKPHFDKNARDKARPKSSWDKGPRDQGSRDRNSKDAGARGKGSWDKRPGRNQGPRVTTPGEAEKRTARPALPPSARPTATPRPARKPEPKTEQFPRTYAIDPTQAQRSPPPKREEIWIYGYHPAAAVLANPQRKILRVVATPEAAERLQQDRSVAAYNLERIRTMDRRDIDGLVGADAVHQGVAVLTRPLEYDLHEILAGLEGRATACLVLLDQVTDPHNVGAILRSAAAFGASAVIAPDRHAPEETGVMAKSASGALDKLPYVKTVNLVRALEMIKEFQFWLVGLDAEAPTVLSDIDLGGRIALVLGAEGEGIRRLVAETCDHRARLPISNAMESLNVSNAAAVALYEKARQTNKPGGKR